MPIIPGLGRPRQEDCHELELAWTTVVSSRLALAIQQDSVSKSKEPAPQYKWLTMHKNANYL